MEQYLAVAVAAVVSAAISALIARFLRLPWWANILAAVVAWFGLVLQLSLWDAPVGPLPWVSAKLTPLPSFVGTIYAVITRGMIGPPDGPLPRSH